jgi:hypothetical protein
MCYYLFQVNHYSVVYRCVWSTYFLPIDMPYLLYAVWKLSFDATIVIVIIHTEPRLSLVECDSKSSYQSVMYSASARFPLCTSFARDKLSYRALSCARSPRPPELPHFSQNCLTTANQCLSRVVIVWLLRSLLFIIIEVVTSHKYYNYLTYISIFN